MKHCICSEQLIAIILEETAGISRFREPVTFGVPFPEGLLHATDDLRLLSHNSPQEARPVQCTPLAIWPDGSLKWVLLDFQATVPPASTVRFDLFWSGSCPKADGFAPIFIRQNPDSFVIDTGAAAFWINRTRFQPFERVVRNNTELLASTASWTRLVGTKDIALTPLIDTIEVESAGPLRATIKITGAFRDGKNDSFANFCSRLHFFAESALVRLEFSLQNPRAAKHPGGLWDLGDAGSMYFKDLSLAFSLNPTGKRPEISLDLAEEMEPPVENASECEGFPVVTSRADLLVYQDSSGGSNWRSRNHVNRDGDVKTSFQGFAVFKNGSMVSRGFRAAPVLGISNQTGGVAATIQHFWQNFPSAIEGEGESLVLRIFPMYFEDLFELQGGEHKNHTVFLQFHGPENIGADLSWTRHPLLPHATPEWYSSAGAVAFLVPRTSVPPGPEHDILDIAVSGKQSFFYRREIIDEYGWRNFGDFYADHEAVGHGGTEPFISHYNNQYDGIWGCLTQYLSTGDSGWFLLGDQLCAHVKDIDIYHTDDDRPEFNHGMFWHTEHYIDAETATHRCYSRKHASKRNLSKYGGGPSLSHNYSSGLLLHYYLTGSLSSREVLVELAEFVSTNLALEQSIQKRFIKRTRKALGLLQRCCGQAPLVDTNKVYGLDGPGRASGNALNTLFDAFVVTRDKSYIARAAMLISRCISSGDDIEERDLLDVENRWMYTIFLQALGKYISSQEGAPHRDPACTESRRALLHYARWMATNERFYLDQRQKLEYPNETWAAQELRKCSVLLYGWQYEESAGRAALLQAAFVFFEGGMRQLQSFDTRTMTRPAVLLLQNVMMYWYFSSSARPTLPPPNAQPPCDQE